MFRKIRLRMVVVTVVEGGIEEEIAAVVSGSHPRVEIVAKVGTPNAHVRNRKQIIHAFHCHFYLLINKIHFNRYIILLVGGLFWRFSR